MRIRMTRYYGDGAVTKSRVEIVGTEFRCEARETGFADYGETFPGCSRFCLPRGEFVCKPLATEVSPMTLTVMKAAGHRSCRFVYSPLHQARSNAVVLGRADESVPPEEREMSDSEEMFEAFQRHVYRAFASGEEMRLEVRNELKSNEERP